MYSRYNAIPGRNKEDLEGKKAAVIGLGATGSVIAEHLAKHGVELYLIDRDYLEIKDLYTSNLYTRKQCEEALPKAVAAQERLEDFTRVTTEVKNVEKASEIPSADIIMDGSDNLQTRKIIEKASNNQGVPWIFSSALSERGFSMFLDQSCFKCVFKDLEPRESCETHGVLREISSIVSAVSSMKAINYLSGERPKEKLEMVPSMQSFNFGECECDGKDSFETLNVCGDKKYQVFGDARPENIKGKVIVENKYLKRVSFEGSEITLFRSGRAIVEAEDQEAAERLYRQASSI